MRNERIALVSGAQPTSNYDVWKGYSHAFRMLDFNVIEIPYHMLFRQWSEYARFFGIVQGDKHWTFDAKDVVLSASLNLVMKIMETEPDYLVIVDGTNIHKSGWEWFKRLGFHTTIIGTESPYQDKSMAVLREYAHTQFTNDIASARKTGFPYLPTAYNTNVHFPIFVPEKMRHDVIFVGSGFPERVKMLEGVDWSGIDFEFYGYYPIAEDNPIAPYYKDTQIANEQAAVLYNGAKVNINLNRVSVDYPGELVVPDAESISPRVYEIAACGGFMLSEYRPELDNIFGDLVPTFTTPEQLNELVHYWLPRDEERREIGEELLRLVKPHSYIERAKIVAQSFL